MNKAKYSPALRLTQQAVSGRQLLDEAAHPVDEVLLSFPIVVKVDIHVGNSLPDESRYTLHECRTVLFFWIEKGILRWPPRGIRMSSRNLRPVLDPKRYAFRRRRVG
jgi:hypothetical protein